MTKLPFKIHLHLHKNGKLFGWGVSPNADWKILFFVFFALIISVFTLSIYMFVAIANGNLFLVDKTPVIMEKKVDPETIKKTVLYYDSRAIKLEEIKANKNQVSDPSL